jgi:hypothetical protein
MSSLEFCHLAPTNFVTVIALAQMRLRMLWLKNVLTLCKSAYICSGITEINMIQKYTL